MFELANLANRVLLLPTIVLHYMPEVGPIFLCMELREKRHFIRHSQGIVLDGLNQHGVFCGIGLSADLLFLVVKFLARDLEDQDVLHVGHFR